MFSLLDPADGPVGDSFFPHFYLVVTPPPIYLDRLSYQLNTCARIDFFEYLPNLTHMVTQRNASYLPKIYERILAGIQGICFPSGCDIIVYDTFIQNHAIDDTPSTNNGIRDSDIFQNSALIQ